MMSPPLLKITVGGLIIRGAPAAADARGRPRGLFVKPNGFTGWDGLPASRREALARAVQHGEHDVPTFLPSRIVTIDGWILARDQTDLIDQMQAVTGVGATGDRKKMTVDHLGQQLNAIGRRLLADAADTGSRRRHLGEFQLQFVFANPRRYGDTQLRSPSSGTSSSFVVSHQGNFPASPVFEIPSAPSSYSISSPGGTFTVTGATAGGVHRVDMRTGRVTRDGVHMPGVGRGNLWAIPNGRGWAHSLSSPGRALVLDTFI